MSLRGWEKLTCNNLVTAYEGVHGDGVTKVCGSEEFTPVVRMTWHEGQGVAAKPDGYKCAKCGAIASTAKMIEAVQKQHLRDKIKELEAQQ